MTKSPELALAHLDSLPTLPAVAVRLLQVTVDQGSDADDVVQLLRADQSLTARVLSVAGSASSGVRTPITTLEKAVPLLGFSTVRSIVLATSVFECFGKPTNGGRFDPIEFWKHSLAVACAARRLAQCAPKLAVEPEDAFVAGLLHDLGKVALNTVFPKAYDRIVAQADHSRGDIADSERTILGADHTVAGRRLGERWRLPAELRDAIWLHHLAIDALPSTVANPSLIGLVQLADTLAREQRIGYSGNHMFYELSPRLAERIGIGTEHVADVVRRLVVDVAEQASLLGLDDETPEVVYVKAMTRANSELGKLNNELLAGNRRLAAAARYFQALSQFEAALQDWADPGAVVVALADSALGALQRHRLAAFGVREGGAAVDVAWTSTMPEDRGHVTQATPMDFAQWRDTTSDHVDAVALQAPQAVRALVVGAVDPTASGTPWLLPIVHLGRIVAGVVYMSESDERTRLMAEQHELRSFLTSMGLALGRANAQAAAQRLSEDLAEANRNLQQAQSDLLRSRTLSMIAEMAAGAAHELNSPLTVISGRAQMLSSSLNDPDVQRALTTISEKAHECSGIVSELMDFANPREPELDTVDLAAVLAEVRAACIADGVVTDAQLRVERCALDEAGTTPTVRGDAAQLRVVIRELIVNAADGIVAAERGSVVVRCQAAVQPGTLELLVTDTGCGMSPAVLQRAFDPFYSYRHAGRRRGLGLPRAYRIVESHGGRIWLESQPGEGTTAHVLLPLATV